MESSFRPSIDEINNFVVASLLVGAALTAYSGILTPANSVFYAATGAAVLLARELGQRIVAQWQDAYVEFQVSLEGSFITVMGATIAILANLPLILLFPVFNEFSGRRYEHWGKTIDAVWMKRQFWIVSGGIIALFLTWLVTLRLGFASFAEAVILFQLFQLLPLDYSEIPTGPLDGAYILRWSGFVWLVMFGATLLAAVLTV